MEVQDAGGDWLSPHQDTVAQSIARKISMVMQLDSVLARSGLGDDPYRYDIRIRAVRNGTPGPNSKTITITDSRLLRVSGDSSASPTAQGKAKVQWGRQNGVINGEYTINIRKSGLDDHHEIGWVPAGWQDTLEYTVRDDDPSGRVGERLEFNTSDLELGKLYGVQISYKTTASHVFSAVHDYVWPSTGFPGDNGTP